MSLPLRDILVVSVEQAVAAPFCTARLADAGARVIKIERDSGDFARQYDRVVNGESAYFVWLNRGKESVVLDIKKAEDLAFLKKVSGKADVFVQNLAPGAAERAGLGWQELRAANPGLITCDISGYGDVGPYRNMKAYDLLIQCESALVAVSGGADGADRIGVSIADICCGMNAYAGILEALLQRHRTGRGTNIVVSLFDGLAEWMTVPLLYREHAGIELPRVGLNHTSIAPYGLYQTGDGTKLVLSVQNDREWKSFCRTVLGQAGLGDDRRFLTNSLRCENRQALNAIINEVLGTMSGDALKKRLTSAGIAFGAVNTISDLSAHPQLRRIEVSTERGPALVPAPPVVVRDSTRHYGAVPALGADTDRVRREFC
jgi:crotonobetainyl-CoA:carnitine CoA-transferase CaiB-like acyl-CoA transferase